MLNRSRFFFFVVFVWVFNLFYYFMLEFSQKTLQSQTPLLFALITIRGLGKNTASTICNSCGLLPGTPMSLISATQVESLLSWSDQSVTKHLYFGAALAKITKKNKQKLVQIKHYRGLRLSNGLPSRGQRTKTNAKTAKKINAWFLLIFLLLLTIFTWLYLATQLTKFCLKQPEVLLLLASPLIKNQPQQLLGLVFFVDFF